MCGLVSKLDYFEENNDIINSHLLLFSETKTDVSSEKIITESFKEWGYDSFFKHRKTLNAFKSGGLVICIKKELRNKCKIISTASPYVFWCSIEKCVLGTDRDILLGGVYVPPEGSEYVSQRCFLDIESEIIDLNYDNRYHVLLAGDLNAHVSNVTDLLESDSIINSDSVIHNVLNLNEVDLIPNISNCTDDLIKLGIPTERSSKDKSRVNNHGGALLDMCKSSSIVIFNGRIGDDKGIGNVTNIKANTIVDYFVGSTALLTNVNNFKVLDFDPTLSDLHCPIFLSFKKLDCGNNMDQSHVSRLAQNNEKYGVQQTTIK